MSRRPWARVDAGGACFHSVGWLHASHNACQDEPSSSKGSSAALGTAQASEAAGGLNQRMPGSTSSSWCQGGNAVPPAPRCLQEAESQRLSFLVHSAGEEGQDTE